jgi:hypothetical protein
VSSDADVGGLAAIFAAIIGAVWAPWSARAKLRRQDKAVLRLIVRGDKAIPGLREAIANMPTRVKRSEDRLDALESLVTLELVKVRRGMGKLTSEVIQFRKERKQLTDLWTVSGGNSNNPADLQHRSAVRTGDWNDDEPAAT